MNWFINSLGSSIGKKLMMAITGLSFCGFLMAHLAGNLTLYGGRDAFNAYAEHLHSLGILLNFAEIGLLSLALIHILTGLYLFWQNFRSRPVRYAVNKSAGGRTIGSVTMPYTGVFLICFVVFHLLNFHFVDKTQTTIYDIVDTAFSNLPYTLIYILAMVIVAIHVSHGLWSAFQTIGANHLKYMPFVQVASIVLALVFAIGFGFLPIYIAFNL
ncbi:MAG: succinate dehydrogenase cytochrome b subunit [Desulfobacteraceae bacterium]|nr:succinate dehydrogenase cytochrome b subunit [Desulfobacteraceae bacterium]